MPESKDMPKIVRLQVQLLVPCNARQIERAGEDGQIETVWTYDIMEHPATTPMGDLEHWRQATIDRLNAELQGYIYAIYDPGTQATLLGYVALALDEGRSDIVAECRKVQDWIDQVLDYYDARKQSLAGAVDEAARMAVTWDFAGDVPATEYVDWRAVKAMFAAVA